MLRPKTHMLTITYLELHRHMPRQLSLEPLPDTQIIQAMTPLPAFYRFLYTEVGREYRWIDRLPWTDEDLHAYLSCPDITLLVLYVQGVPAGYIELDRENTEEPGTKIAYFGLMPAFQGHGLGRYLLSVGIQRAFDDGASRIWLNTCTLDGLHALANYQARGFVPYTQVSYPH